MNGLPVGGFDGGVGKLGCAADSAPVQPPRQPSGTQQADRCRGLKTAHQHQRPQLSTLSIRSALITSTLLTELHIECSFEVYIV
jgi:hypothetical protein